jgi:hypothetical protein
MHACLPMCMSFIHDSFRPCDTRTDIYPCVPFSMQIVQSKNETNAPHSGSLSSREPCDLLGETLSDDHRSRRKQSCLLVLRIVSPMLAGDCLPCVPCACS